MELRIQSGVLTQHIHGVQHQLAGVERIDPLPRRRRGMGGLAVELIQTGGQRLKGRRCNILVVQMDHDGQIICFKNAVARHGALGAVLFLIGRPDHMDVGVQLILQITQGQTCQKADAAAQTVAARVSDLRQGVIFGQDGNFVFVIVGTIDRTKRRFQSGKGKLSSIPMLLQQRHVLLGAPVLLPGQFRMTGNIIILADQLCQMRFDRFSDACFHLFVCHRFLLCSLVDPTARPVRAERRRWPFLIASIHAQYVSAALFS